MNIRYEKNREVTISIKKPLSDEEPVVLLDIDINHLTVLDLAIKYLDELSKRYIYIIEETEYTYRKHVLPSDFTFVIKRRTYSSEYDKPSKLLAHIIPQEFINKENCITIFVRLSVYGLKNYCLNAHVNKINKFIQMTKPLSSSIFSCRSNNNHEDILKNPNSAISLQNLPRDILRLLRPKLHLKDLYSLTRTCRGLRGIFQPELNEIRFQQLKTAVANGKRDKVEKILKTHPNILLKKSQGYDSPFQMAAWGLNWHMWTIMLKYLPKEKYQEAGQQLQELETHGSESGPHYDATPLISALRNYAQRYRDLDYDIDYDNPPTPEKEAELTHLWCKEVGLPQRMIPIALVLEYCRNDHSFYPTPNYENDTAPPTNTTTKFYNWMRSRNVSWFPLPKGLGDVYAIMRHQNGEAVGWCGSACKGVRGPDAERVDNDLAAVTAWYKVGQKKLLELKQILQNPAFSQEAVPTVQTSAPGYCVS